MFRGNGSLLGLEYSSEQSEAKKEKSSISRKLTFRRNQESSKEKEKRKPKRTASVNGPSGYSIVDYRGKRSKGNLSPRALNKVEHVRHNSSGESSVASGNNLASSVPYDLPGTVGVGERLGFSSPVSDRPGSALTLEDVSISMSQPETVDVSVQCSPGESSITRYHPANSSPVLPPKGEHSKRLHSVNTLTIHASALQTQSLPGTPTKKRRSPDTRGFHGREYYGGGPKSPPVPFLHEQLGRVQYAKQALSNRSKEIQELRNGLNGSISADQVLMEVSDYN